MDKSVLSKPFRFFGIDFAPLSLPMERRLQTFAAFISSSTLFIGLPGVFFLSYYLMRNYQWIALAYLSWFIYDFMTPFRGGRNLQGFVCQSLRNCSGCKYLKKYFPMQLIKTAELDPNKGYLLGSHPHGFFSSGCFSAFASNDKDFEKLYPNMRSKVMLATNLFIIPFLREIYLALGATSCTKSNMEIVLKKGKGLVNVLIVGGAREAMDFDNKDNVMRLYLEKRKGFIKMAIRYGSDLVPSITFGEGGVYRQFHHPILRKIQLFFADFFGAVPLIMYGRGIFQYSFGYLPLRSPLNVVVGKPIVVDMDPNPSREKIEELHRIYINELKELYEKYNPLYGDPNVKLEIL